MVRKLAIHKTLTLSVLLVDGALALAAQTPKTSLLPNEQLNAIVNETSGELPLDTIIGLGRFHRVPGTAGFDEGAQYILAKAKEYGLEARLESFPADGKATYNTFKSYLGWEVASAVLLETTPREREIANYAKNPIVLADYSNSADVTADLVDVGAGTSSKDYLEKSVRGKIVLAAGSTLQVQTMAVERGAIGVLSYFGNQDTIWTGEHPQLIRWGHLPAYTSDNKFAFMIAPAQAKEFKARLASGESIRLHTTVKTRRAPGAYNVVTAVIHGTDAAAGEIFYSCHLDHQKPSSNDNASGCSTILEDARILQKLINEGKLPAPRRTIRFVFPTEIIGTTCYLARHRDLVPNIRATIHMDMVGGNPAITHSVLHITRTPASIPSYVNDVGEVFGEFVIQGSKRYVMEDDGADAILSLAGTKDPLWADFTPFSLGSDHEVYESSYHIPALYLRDYPDIFIHTDGDRPANIDSTKLRRVALIGAASGYFLSNVGATGGRSLVMEVFTRGAKRQIDALQRALHEQDDHEAFNDIAQAARQERAALASVLEVAPEQQPLIDQLTPQINARESEANALLMAGGRKAPLPEETPHGKIVPRRNPAFIGLLNVGSGVYSPGLGDTRQHPIDFGVADSAILTYDALNLVDGRRTISQIRDTLSAAYASVPQEALYEYFKELESHQVVSLQ